MRKLLLAATCLLLGSYALADIAVTPGSGKTVATTTDNSREFQNVVASTMNVRNDLGVSRPIGYDTANSSYMPVSIQAGSIANTGFNVNNFPATQPVSVATPYTVFVSTVGIVQSTVTVVGPSGQSVNVVSTGTALTTSVAEIGNVKNTGTFAVQAAQSGAYTLTITTVGVVYGGAAGTNLPTQVNASTSGIVYGGAAGTNLPVQVNNSTMAISGLVSLNLSTFTFQAPNNNTTAIPVSGVFTATYVDLATATYDTAFPNIGNAEGYVGPTGLMQAGRVDVSSNIYVMALQPNAFNVVSTSTLVLDQVLVSSNTSMPNPQADVSSGTIMADQYRRIVTMSGVPSSILLTTSPVSTSAGYIVLVASPSSTLFSHLVGCIWRNSSATGVSIDMYNSGNAANAGTVDVPIQAVATDNRGIWTGADKPFLNTTIGGVQITAKVSAAVSSITGYCQYYQTLTP